MTLRIIVTLQKKIFLSSKKTINLESRDEKQTSTPYQT